MSGKKWRWMNEAERRHAERRGTAWLWKFWAECRAREEADPRRPRLTARYIYDGHPSAGWRRRKGRAKL